MAQGGRQSAMQPAGGVFYVVADEDADALYSLLNKLNMFEQAAKKEVHVVVRADNSAGMPCAVTSRTFPARSS